jgi:hypothetical protein
VPGTGDQSDDIQFAKWIVGVEDEAAQVGTVVVGGLEAPLALIHERLAEMSSESDLEENRQARPVRLAESSADLRFDLTDSLGIPLIVPGVDRACGGLVHGRHRSSCSSVA